MAGGRIRSQSLLRALAAYALLLSVATAATTTLTTTITVGTVTSTVTLPGGSTRLTVSTEVSAITATSVVPSSHTMASTSTASTASTAAIATGAAAYSGPAFVSAVLNSTNTFRAQHQAKPLNWGTELASYAQNYAQGCLFKHSGGPHGENLASGFNDPTGAVDAWAAEEKYYNYAKAKFSEQTGHFTQLVWKNTTSVGCGAVLCNNTASGGVQGWYLVCEYDPPGNVAGQFRQMVTKPGEGTNGRLGFGVAARFSGSLQLTVTFLLVCMLLWF